MRRWSLAVLSVCLLALCAPAFAGAFALPMGESSLLVGESGEALTQPGEYEWIEELGGGLFSARKTEQRKWVCVALDDKGERIGENAFEDLYALEGVLYAVEGGLTGVVDRRMQYLVPCAYTQLVSNGEGGYLALTSDPYDERPDGVYYIGPDGGERATGIRIQYGLASFSEGLMPVMDGVSGRMGYMNPAGEWEITAQYEYAGEFRGGVAEAALTAGSGFIDRMGNWLLTPKYAAVDRSEGGDLVLAQEDSGEAVLLNPENFSVIKRYTGTDIYFSACFEADLAVLYLDDCTQLIDNQGNVLIECGVNSTFDAWTTAGDRILVSLGDWGEKCVWMYDLKGNRLAGPWQEAWLLGISGEDALFAAASFDVIEMVDVETAWHTYSEVEGTRRIQVVDRNGAELIAPRELTQLSMDESGYLIYETSGEVGAMDAEGDVLCAFPTAQ